MLFLAGSDGFADKCSFPDGFILEEGSLSDEGELFVIYTSNNPVHCSVRLQCLLLVHTLVAPQSVLQQLAPAALY